MSDNTERLQQLALAKKALRKIKIRDAIDPLVPESRPTPAQVEVLEGLKDFRRLYILGGNRSGKTMVAGRIAAWFFDRDCPFVDIEAKWPGDPLTILVVARTSEHYTELWEKKIRPALAPGSYREERQGGTLARVRHTKNGSKIIFQSHHNPQEAREKLQFFSAHLVVLDEQTDSLPLLEELIRRTGDKDGYFVNPFTPKMPAPAVKKYIEKPHRLAKIFKLKMLDNPAFAGREQDIMDDIANLPVEMQLTILEGDWYQDTGKVYNYQPDLHRAMPQNYNPLFWRHAEFIDPAASGKVGFGLAAEEPHSGQWYVIRAKYLNGEAASDLLDKIEAETFGLNVTHRMCDPHEAWFLKEAAKRGRHYLTPKKDDRKEELVKGVSEALKSWLRIAPGSPELEDELFTAEWDPKHSGRIINGTRFHLLDALQYFVDLRPRWEPPLGVRAPLVELDLANRARKKKEAVAREAKTKRRMVTLKPAMRRWR